MMAALSALGDYLLLDGLLKMAYSSFIYSMDYGTAMKKIKKPVIHQMTIKQFERAFPHENACCEYLVRHRWPSGVCCPRCGSVKVYELKTMNFKWECPDCREGGAYRFSHLVGTIFENTNKPLRDWFRVIHMMLTSKKGVSALQVKRVLGFGSYETAWSMCHRIRLALTEQGFQQLMGIVEVDETFIGGKRENIPLSKRIKHDKNDRGGGASGKTTIVGAVQRKGKVVAKVIAKMDATTLQMFVREAVSRKVSLLCTDQWMGYYGLDIDYRHKTVNHARHQYVVGAIHTNTIEGFWSIIKRGIVGTFHRISAKYLPLYVAEFQFRYNNRMNDNIFGAAIKAC
jgi:transposase-like protein